MAAPRLVFIDTADVPDRVWRGVDFLLSALKTRPRGLLIPGGHEAVRNSAVLLAAALGLVEVNATVEGDFILQLPDRSGETP